jgi:crossover junction endodeoxyribonuclease RusA
MCTVSTWDLTYDAKPWSLNQERTKHWAWRRERVEEWKGAFYWLAKDARVPSMDRIAVTVDIEMPGIVQDVCNGYPAAKAAIDGLVIAGVIPDDTPEHLVAVTFLAPRHAKQPRFTLTVERR